MINGSACQLFHTHLFQIWIPIPLDLDTHVIWSLTTYLYHVYTGQQPTFQTLKIRQVMNFLST